MSDVWTIGSLANGESARLFLRVVAVGSGILNNNVAVTSDTFDYDLSNNNDFATVNVTEKAPNNKNSSRNSNSDDDWGNDELSRRENLTKNTLDAENSHQKVNLVKKSPKRLEMNPTANPILILLISLIFSAVLSGAKISKK